MVSAAVARRCTEIEDTAKTLLHHHSLNFNNKMSLYPCLPSSFNLLFRALVWPCEYPTLCQTRRLTYTRCQARSPSSPLSLSFLFLSLPFTLSRAPLQHMPTHAAAQAHVIWNCILPSFSHSLYLSYLSLTYIHVHAPWGSDSHLSLQIRPPLLLSLFLYSFLNLD